MNLLVKGLVVSGQNEDARSTIKANVVMDDNTIVLTPLDSEGKELLQQILDAGPAKSAWHFQGSRYKTPGVKDRLIGVSYACGGEGYWRQDGNARSKDYKGSIKVHFDLTDVSDEDALYAMRDFGYFGSGLVIQPDSTAEQMRLGSPKACKVCGGELRGSFQLEWKVCDSCAEVCDHEYEEGVGQSNGHIAYLPFCTKCGRADPNWKPNENPAKDMLKTVSEGGVDALVVKHPDGSATTITKA